MKKEGKRRKKKGGENPNQTPEKEREGSFKAIHTVDIFKKKGWKMVVMMRGGRKGGKEFCKLGKEPLT